MSNKIINIKAHWDDDTGNISYKGKHYEKHKVSITGFNFKNWNPLNKLDFFTDLENWMQSEINEIHDQLGEHASFVYSYVANCPKSTKQHLAEQKDPNYKKIMMERAKKIRIETDNKISGKGKVIKFPKNKELNNVK
jgi:hypothetical protein